MREAYIVGAIRTATGRKKGRLSGLHPVDMGAIVVDELLDQTGVPSDGVDDVIFGVVSQIGSQAGNLGRNVAMSSKLDLEVPGTTVDRQCGSSLQAIQFGAQAVMSGIQEYSSRSLMVQSCLRKSMRLPEMNLMLSDSGAIKKHLRQQIVDYLKRK